MIDETDETTDEATYVGGMWNARHVDAHGPDLTKTFARKDDAEGWLDMLSAGGEASDAHNSDYIYGQHGGENLAGMSRRDHETAMVIYESLREETILDDAAADRLVAGLIACFGEADALRRLAHRAVTHWREGHDESEAESLLRDCQEYYEQRDCEFCDTMCKQCISDFVGTLRVLDAFGMKENRNYPKYLEKLAECQRLANEARQMRVTSATEVAALETVET